MSQIFPSLLRLGVLLAALVCFATAWAGEKLLVSVPGPRNISYLPLDLAPMIGADKEEGVELVLHHVAVSGLFAGVIDARWAGNKP